MMKKLKVGSDYVKVGMMSTQDFQDSFPDKHEPGDILWGLCLATQRAILINSDLADNQQFTTLIHEIGEQINSDYSLDLSHIQLSAFTHAFATILKENAKEFKALL